MNSPKKDDPRKEKIRKYFSDRDERELIIFGKQHAAVRRISDYVISVSEEFFNNNFKDAVAEDKVIMRIEKVLDSHLAGYTAASAAILAKLKANTPLRDDSKRKGGLRKDSI